jgi:hypothetical protein
MGFFIAGSVVTLVSLAVGIFIGVALFTPVDEVDDTIVM